MSEKLFWDFFGWGRKKFLNCLSVHSGLRLTVPAVFHTIPKINLFRMVALRLFLGRLVSEAVENHLF